jgi:uncharacterized protein (UPF0210 family)
MTKADERLLIESLPQALVGDRARVLPAVNVGSTKTGIDMDAVELLVGRKIRRGHRVGHRAIPTVPAMSKLVAFLQRT